MFLWRKKKRKIIAKLPPYTHLYCYMLQCIIIIINNILVKITNCTMERFFLCVHGLTCKIIGSSLVLYFILSVLPLFCKHEERSRHLFLFIYFFFFLVSSVK